MASPPFSMNPSTYGILIIVVNKLFIQIICIERVLSLSASKTIIKQVLIRDIKSISMLSLLEKR